MTGRQKLLASLSVLAVVVVAATAATIAGASTSGRSSSAADTLRILGFGPGDEIANVRADIAEKALGGANVDNPRGGFNDQQFLASVASGSVPDLVYLDRQKVGTYAAKGAFVPLTSCVAKEKINLKQYRIATLKEDTYKGKLYAIPEFSNQRTIIANNDVLKSAGLTLNSVRTNNWKALAAANKKLLKTDGGKVTRIGFDPKLPEFFPLWVKANGADILSKDGLHAQLNSKKAIEALTFAYSLIQAHGGYGPFKSFRDTFDFFGSKNEFAQDQLGAFPIESFYYNVLAQNSPQVNISALPFQNRKGGAITYFTGSGWAIPKGAKNPDLACKWMKAITNAPTWVSAAKVRFDAQRRKGAPFTGVYTANAVADVKIFQDIYQPMGKKSFDDAVKLLVYVGRYAFTVPPSPAGSEFQTAWMDAVNRVLAGQQSVKAALNQAQKEAQTAIDRNK